MAAGLHANSASPIAIWTAQDRQRAFIACPVFEILFGGARGGGKTDACLGDFLEHADTYNRHAVGLMVRRRRTELVETIERSRLIYSPLGWTFNETKNMWTAPNGARLRFAFLERDADADLYQGHSYSRLYVEEITNFPDPKPILKLMATLRSGAGVAVGFRATGNPGGAGHHWVKARYIDPAPHGGRVITDPATGLQRVFIPSKVADNRFLSDDYVRQLKASGSPELVRAWLDGDWTVVQGAFFSEWDSDVIISPFAIPKEWSRFRSADWGYATPFSINWFAVVGDDHQIEGGILPRGALVNYREWYGASAPNVGLRLTAEDVAAGIKQRERGERLGGRNVIDPSTFAQTSGPSIAERLARRGVVFRPADNKRVSTLGAFGGWDQMRARLKNRKLFFFSTCTEAIRTIPMLQHDPDKPEDLNTEQEDHSADSVRYACMSRPFTPLLVKAEPEKPRWAGDGLTVNDLIGIHKGAPGERVRV